MFMLLTEVCLVPWAGSQSGVMSVVMIEVHLLAVQEVSLI